MGITAARLYGHYRPEAGAPATPRRPRHRARPPACVHRPEAGTPATASEDDRGPRARCGIPRRLRATAVFTQVGADILIRAGEVGLRAFGDSGGEERITTWLTRTATAGRSAREDTATGGCTAPPGCSSCTTTTTGCRTC